MFYIKLVDLYFIFIAIMFRLGDIVYYQFIRTFLSKAKYG